MSREKESYRDNLEQLTSYFGKRRLLTLALLTLADVAEYTNRDPRTVRKKFNIDPKKGITTAAFARLIS